MSTASRSAPPASAALARPSPVNGEDGARRPGRRGRALRLLGDPAARRRTAAGARARHRRASNCCCDPPAAVPASFAALVERRAAHEPVAYITGTRAFWTIDLAVGPGVLVPRADSETLIEAAVAHFADRAPGDDPRPRHRAGHAAARRARPMAGRDRASASTPSGRARLCARAMPNGSAWPRARTSRPAAGRGTGARFDLILCNPPYIATGEVLPREVARIRTGRGAVRRARRPRRLPRARAAAARAARARRLRLYRDRPHPGGGGHGAPEAAGLNVALRRDLGGRDRCLIATP